MLLGERKWKGGREKWGGMEVEGGGIKARKRRWNGEGKESKMRTKKKWMERVVTWKSASVSVK